MNYNFNLKRIEFILMTSPTFHPVACNTLRVEDGVKTQQKFDYVRESLLKKKKYIYIYIYVVTGDNSKQLSTWS